jgi:hypothetical protein
MADDTARTNPVSPQGSKLWAEDNALARVLLSFKSTHKRTNCL